MKNNIAPTLFAALLVTVPLAARASETAPQLEAGSLALPNAATTAPASERLLGYDALTMLPPNNATVSTGQRFSVTSFSSGAPAFVGNDPISQTQRLVPAFGSAMANYPGSMLNRGNDAVPTQFGGRASMDLGSGVSLNVIGGVTKLPANAFLSPDPMWSLTPHTETYSHVGGGVSFDLGRGSSLSLTGTMSKSNAGRCAGASFALCP